MKQKPLHLSHSVHHGDGGIAFAVSDLLSAQQFTGIYARWLSADRYPPHLRNRLFANAIFDAKANLLHCHGLWRTQTRVAKQFINSGLPIIVSPHGMLDDWAMAHSYWKKEIVWNLWEKSVLNSSSCIHALCDAEAKAIQRRLPDVPVAVIPNGVHPPDNIVRPRHILPWANLIPQDEKVLLFLGRYHQKKGLEPLMTAWQSVLDDSRKSKWWLVLLGFGDSGKFESQLKAFPVDRCLAFGPVFGERKIAAFQHASAFVLPSYSEGLPMAALEAMSYSLPCLLSSACNIPEAFNCNAALPAEPESSELIVSLKRLFALSEDTCRAIGLNGKLLTKSQFDWPSIAQQMSEVYGWVLGQSPRPYFVSSGASNKVDG